MSKRVEPEVETFARIRVVGVGGSGCNAINHMINSKVRGVEFVAVNSDAQDLHRSLSRRKVHIGKNLTRGLGTGMNPELGKRAAEETRQQVQETLQGSDMVFITCGMGGGTGTGAAPVIAKIAKEVGALVIAIVTKPFGFEGAQRKDIAERGLADLKKEVDAFIVIPNDKLLAIVEQTLSLKQAFALCDEVLREAVEGVSDIIRTPGDINTDFNDIKAVMEGAGPTLMGIGIAEGDERAKEAAKRAVNSPLLDISISGAKGVLWVVAHSDDLGIMEVHEASKIISESVDKTAKIIWGVMKDNKLKKGQVRIIVIATGFPESAAHASHSGNERSLFSMSAEKREEERGHIYHEVLSARGGSAPGGKQEDEPDKMDIPKNAKKQEKEEPIVTAIPHKREGAPPAPEDDEAWGAIPAFLRRHKK
ncbi:cell division protein FtsZ [Candidatus Kaiserbacteria bacterium RIFCSPLOWO2_02_FULL_54_13]|uniref:Cell division protein FtsZ n=1 Tax=Candidatus Kaiserbacteria bacterium RIFCSPHIGHO2_02_FULL_54_22 TaxID=1798495 RepID=A0A1F6DMY0_9BACT|nr:MAG: Cell division protein ftsZ [Parcubacteria group bacterium GW2011_GWB1_55_9]OGG62382.1 MAG: cell division protein FtsZ [Candidatus Kaiserbacteria bacterium RIFCSPHIGHO2_02_FULL_54_22]OGG68094.1 MAG: cell division protein FtsZ [Candidatus Kaiserbacteria bacterium RIFCSPHIGHO2_12_FULL_54_16]OGG83140.1 MAG: cell division protein FtsZ [Candidatus Kaiserbacteria bacterium RIFCSPLOWO2_02_FULL_54_13]OGG90256.1 MAG: cell division protein FtsZ [Candidatus Kaiserbacteria bacterium RIFCSPLOWO2_12_F